jgi:hypothetical protein
MFVYFWKVLSLFSSLSFLGSSFQPSLSSPAFILLEFPPSPPPFFFLVLSFVVSFILPKRNGATVTYSRHSCIFNTNNRHASAHKAETVAEACLLLEIPVSSTSLMTSYFAMVIFLAALPYMLLCALLHASVLKEITVAKLGALFLVV